jgi:hypothetical protein
MEEKTVPLGLISFATLIVGFCIYMFLASLPEDASDIEKSMREAIQLSMYPDAVKWYERTKNPVLGIVGFNGFEPSESRFDTLAADIYKDTYAIYRLSANDTTLIIKAISHKKFDEKNVCLSARINGRRELIFLVE